MIFWVREGRGVKLEWIEIGRSDGGGIAVTLNAESRGSPSILFCEAGDYNRSV